MSPMRAAWGSPVWGVKPKEQSTLLPSLIAQSEDEPPRWQEIARNSVLPTSSGR